MTSDHKINKIHENLEAIVQKVDNNEFDVQGNCVRMTDMITFSYFFLKRILRFFFVILN
jgi:hypothetical protein